MLTRLIPTGMALPIVRGPLRGGIWIAGSAAGGGKGLSRIFNLVEPYQIATAKRLATPDAICFDIGANVGHYTLLFSRYAQHVYAFEPLPRNLRYLVRLVELNRLKNVTVVPWAVAGDVGVTAFQAGDNNALGHLAREGDQPVATISCDEFVRRYGVVPDLMKIDVEGAEVEVLRGAETLLRAHHPALLLSTHGDDLKQTCRELLTEFGYHKVVPLDAAAVEDAAELSFT